MNKGKNCFGDGLQKQLITKAYQVSATATATTSGTIDVPTGRGDIVAMSVKVMTATLADVDAVYFTIDANGITLLENSPSGMHSTLFNIADRIYNVYIPESSTIGYSIVNDSASAIIHYFEFFFAPAKKK